MKTITSPKHRLLLALIFSFAIFLAIQNPAIQSICKQMSVKHKESIEKCKDSLEDMRNEIRNGIQKIKNHPYFRSEGGDFVLKTIVVVR